MKRQDKITQQIEEMNGGTFIYAKQTHEVKKVIIDKENGEFEILTNLNRFKRKFESAEEFLKYWEPASGNEVQLYSPNSEQGLADEMIEILKGNIKKVQENEAYVKQATAVNKNVNSIINIVRTKMEFMKQSRKS